MHAKTSKSKQQPSRYSTKPKVTVGICVRNCEKVVEDAIQSVINQSFPKELIEIVFIDDGSKDQTLLKISMLASKISIPSIILHTSWKGLGHARNMVIDKAKGDYILWVDGDMFLTHNYLSRLVRFMETHQEVGIVKGRLSLKPGIHLLSTLETYSRAAEKTDISSKKGSKALGTGGALYRKKALLQSGRFNEELRGYGEDWDIELKIRAAGWSLMTIDAEFLEDQRHKLTWKMLWKKYWLRGYHTFFFLQKNPSTIKHYRMFPPAAFASGLLYASKLFKLTHKKKVYCLPFLHFFKMTAWYKGFISNHNRQLT